MNGSDRNGKNSETWLTEVLGDVSNMTFVFQPLSLEEMAPISIFPHPDEAVLQQRRYDQLCTFLAPALEPSMMVTRALGCYEGQNGFQRAEGFPTVESQVESQLQSPDEVRAWALGNRSYHLE